MKYIVAYSVWNKIDMLTWMLEGITENFNPADTEVVFHFDVCSDDSIIAFHALKDYWLARLGFKHKILVADQKGPQLREVGGHNKILHYMMEETDAQSVIIAQDDQRFNQPIVAHLDKLDQHYGNRLGVITGRDGYYWQFQKTAGSFWSDTYPPVQIRLAHGEWQERPCMNTGPLVYNRNVVSKVGYQDELFWAYYSWDDYALRAKNAGFVNGVLGMDITHAKFGRITSTWLSPHSNEDLARLKQKHSL